MVWVNWRYFTDNWLERAERERGYIDDGDRFISLWIAFNGWMRGTFGEDMGDRRQIESVKGKSDFKRVFNKFKTEDTAFSECLEELEALPVMSMRFINSREDIYKYDGTFETLIEVIYQVRCNLFHGRKNINEDERDLELVKLSYRIMLPLFKKYLSYSQTR